MSASEAIGTILLIAFLTIMVIEPGELGRKVGAIVKGYQSTVSEGQQ